MAAATPTGSNNRLYVSNLPFSLEDEAFEKLFAAHGTVQEARIVRNQRNRRSRGYGFVLFANDSEASAARDALDGNDVEGRPMAIEIAHSEGPRESKPRPVAPAEPAGDAKLPVVDETPGCRIWISNLDWNTDDDTLNNLVVAYGTVEECRIVRDRRSNRSRGYAFVKFASPSEADAAVESMNGMDIGDREVKVEIANSKGPHASSAAPRPRRARRARRRGTDDEEEGEVAPAAPRKPADNRVGRRVYVSHLDPAADEDVLRATFGPFGEIEACEVVQDTRNPDEIKAYGFVTFLSSEAADSAVANLNDTQIGAYTSGVELARARGRRRRGPRGPRAAVDAAPAEHGE